MKIAIMQPYFFPYIGYWQLINAVDKFVVYDDVNFIKGGWINRNNILLNGQKHLITLPLNGASSHKLINEIDIVEKESVKLKLLKKIEAAYKNAPYFNVVYPKVEQTVISEFNNISDVVFFSIQELVSYLKIDTEILKSSNIPKDNNLKSVDKVIDIVRNLGGSVYINAIGGQELYQKKDFWECGIELKFIKTNNIEYKQFDNEFVSGLSIIDVMMFNSPEQIKKMLDNYELI